MTTCSAVMEWGTLRCLAVASGGIAGNVYHRDEATPASVCKSQIATLDIHLSPQFTKPTTTPEALIDDPA